VSTPFTPGRVLGLGLVVVLGVVLLSFASGASAGAAAANCQVIAGPPTDYFGLVFADGRIECSAPVNKMRITVALEKDGLEVARQTRNDCQKRTVCFNSTTNVPDEPGNQRWCSRAWGTAQGTYLGEVVACEDQEF
jgi:hypothetical protein